MLFHHSFLNILKGKDPLETQKYEYTRIFSVDVNDIIDTASYYLQGVKRQQYLIETDNNYYIARDLKTNTVYMCYKNVMMLDFDTIDDVKFLSDEIEKSFKIYKTNRGYHAFCVSEIFDYRNKETVEYMLKYKDLGLDTTYIRYCYIRGFCVRLNKKFNETNKDNYTYVTTTNPELVDKNLNDLVDLHILKCKDYNDDYNLNLN